MATEPLIHADGSSPADARRVEVDRSKDKYRWCCPNGHTTWSKTNSHIWCPSCARSPDDRLDPEHWELLDKKTGETIPYSAVVLV